MLTNILAELRSPALERSFRGYAVQPVERLLAQAAAALEDLEDDREQLHARLEAAERQLTHYRQLQEETREAMLNELRTSARAVVAQVLQEVLGHEPAAASDPGARGPAGPAPASDERSLRGMLARARESWRAATAQPPPPQDPDRPR